MQERDDDCLSGDLRGGGNGARPLLTVEAGPDQTRDEHADRDEHAILRARGEDNGERDSMGRPRDHRPRQMSQHGARNPGDEREENHERQ